MGSVSHTTFCLQDQSRVLETSSARIAYTCSPCPEGQRSWGGTQPCLDCGSTHCVPAAPHHLEVEFPSGDLIAHGDILYVAAAAFNTGQASHTTSFSHVVEVDLTPPNGGYVFDVDVNCSNAEQYQTSPDAVGSPGEAELEFSGERDQCSEASTADIDQTRSTKTVGVAWNSFIEDSAVVSYQCCMGTAPGLCDILPITDVGNRNSVVLELPNAADQGDILCASVEAINAAGLVSQRISSDCMTVDITPPQTLRIAVTSEERATSHMSAQTSGYQLFGAAAAFDAETPIKGFEWCAASGEALLAMNESACDLSSLTLASPSHHNPQANMPHNYTDETLSRFGVELDAISTLRPGSSFYLGGRAINSLGLIGEWMWSQPTKIGGSEATVDPAVEKTTVNVDTVLPPLDTLAGGHDLGGSPKVTTVEVGIGTSGVSYMPLGNDELMRARRTQEVGYEPTVGRPRRARRLASEAYQSQSDSAHKTNVAFAMQLAKEPGASNESEFRYSLTFDAADILLPGDPALENPRIMANLVPNLLYQSPTSNSTHPEWLYCEDTCAVPTGMNEAGMYSVGVCGLQAQGSPVNFMLMLQSAPIPAATWTDGTIGDPNATNLSVIERYRPYIGHLPTRLSLNGSGSVDLDNGIIVSYEWMHEVDASQCIDVRDCLFDEASTSDAQVLLSQERYDVLVEVQMTSATHLGVQPPPCCSCWSIL